jgi:hypothetical protein
MAYNRFNRTGFYRTEIVDGIEEIDLTSYSVADFRFNREKTFYKITEEDLKRPDLIAIKAYGDINAMYYWHIILYVNDIYDVFNDLEVGQIISVPNRKDLEELVVFNRNMRNAE